MTVRESFVEFFGEDNALRVEEASIGHVNDAANADVHKNDSWGSDPFRYHLMNCISRDCFTKWSQFHGFTDLDVDDVRAWAITYAELHHFDGDMPDYLGLFAGAYTSWINWDQVGMEPPSWATKAEAEHKRLANLGPDELAKELHALAAEAARLLNFHDNPDGK